MAMLGDFSQLGIVKVKRSFDLPERANRVFRRLSLSGDAGCLRHSPTTRSRDRNLPSMLMSVAVPAVTVERT